MDFIVWMGVRLARLSGSLGTGLWAVVNCVTVWLIVCNWLNCFCACDNLVFWLNCLCLLLFVCCLGCICGIGWIGWQFGKLWEVRDILWYCASCLMFLELRVLSGFLGCCLCCMCCWIFWDWLESWDCWEFVGSLESWMFWDCWYCWVFCDSFMPVWYSMRLVQFMVVFKLFWTYWTKDKRMLWLYDFWDSQNFRTNYIIWL